MFKVCDCRSGVMAGTAGTKEMKSTVVFLIKIC